MPYTSRETYEFVSKQSSDPILEWSVCVVSGAEFPIFQSDKDFLKKISPTFAGQKFQIPLPTLCPEEREKIRLAMRNERHLYRRKCSASGKDIISNYSPDKPYKVYDREVRWSDQRDPMDYGRDIDFQKTFFEQYRELYVQMPRPSSITVVVERSDYNNHCGYLKDCYMCFDVGRLEDCLYVSRSYYDTYSMDLSFTGHCEQCYNLTESYECNRCTHSLMLSSCSSCHRCYNCQGCTSCFLCSNLVNKQYYIAGISYTKDQYYQQIATVYQQQSEQQLQDQYTMMMQKSLRVSTSLVGCEEVIGNLCKNTKQSTFVFSIQDSEQMKYCEGEIGSLALMDDNFSGGKQAGSSSYSYMTVGCESCSHLLFCFSCLQGCRDLYYCDFCHGCSYCFGCVGLRNKSYCIFNTQYTKEEYELIVAELVAHMQKTGEWGVFFHTSLYPFGYNETVANEYYPMTQEEALARGYNRSGYSSDPVIPEGTTTIQKKDYSDSEWSVLRDDDDILKKIFVCSVSGRPFRIVKKELEFYRRYHLPLPDKHSDIRHSERIARRPGKTLYLRTCDKCSKEMLSVYPNIIATSRKSQATVQGTGNLSLEAGSQRVYCETCYQHMMFA